MNRIAAVVAAVSLAFVGTSATFADTINVPGDQPTIAAAISASVNGDTIQIASGTYNEHSLNTGGKAITIIGAINGDGTPATIIDGNNSHRILKCNSGETDATVIMNLVIQNGNESNGNGAGIDIESGSSPKISNCVFSNNSASGSGGGIFCYDGSSPTIENCLFDSNVGSTNGGGISTSMNCSPVLTNCRFTGNSGEQGGGMMNANGSNASLTDCIFEGNVATSWYGGGMSNTNSSLVSLTNCTFTGNSTSLRGGAMFNFNGSDVTIIGCTIKSNTAGEGGGMYNSDATPTIHATTVCGNTPDQINGSYTDGGGNEILTSCLPTIINVPDDYATIAAAISASVNGDVINIAAGTYNESGIDLDGKNITISGAVNADGSPSVTIDAQFADTVISCDSDAQFENLIITGGSGDDGGGMHVSGSQPHADQLHLDEQHRQERWRDVQHRQFAIAHRLHHQQQRGPLLAGAGYRSWWRHLQREQYTFTDEYDPFRQLRDLGWGHLQHGVEQSFDPRRLHGVKQHRQGQWWWRLQRPQFRDTAGHGVLRQRTHAPYRCLG